MQQENLVIEMIVRLPRVPAGYAANLIENESHHHFLQGVLSFRRLRTSQGEAMRVN